MPSKKPLPQPRQHAKVIERAQIDDASGAGVDNAILKRISGCLARANHQNTSRPEAETALKMARKLMVQHNVTQAEVLASTAPEEQSSLAGASTVKVANTRNTNSKAILQTWVSRMSFAIQTLFDCKCYTTAYSTKIDFTFYGIAGNTVAAAEAFEMVHNLVLEWARPKLGKMNSYCLGVAQGLNDIANEEKDRETEAAKLREAQDKLATDDVSREPSPAQNEHATKFDDVNDNNMDDPYGDSSSDVSNDMFRDCFDEDEADYSEEDETSNTKGDALPQRDQSDWLQSGSNFNSSTKVESEPIVERNADVSNPNDCDSTQIKEEDQNTPDHESSHPPPNEKTSIWTTSQALVRWRLGASNVADEYLKSSGQKVCKGRKRSWNIRDQDAYNQGQEDSKKIDLKRKKIEA